MAGDDLEITEGQKELLQELILARGPAGVEQEVADICLRELSAFCDETWQDLAGNVVALIRAGKEATTEPLRILAHMDEIALIVKRIYGEGQLRIIKLGGLQPMSFGQCPVDIMGDRDIVPGIMSIGSLHVTKETADLTTTSDDKLDWDDIFITTRLSNAQLRERGVHAGSRVVIGRYMRRLFEFEDCVAGHFMDDRALILVGIEAMRELARTKDGLTRDVYFICTVKEEVTNSGALYAVRQLPGDEVLALEVGPIAAEYDTKLCEDPIVLYGDMKGFYSTDVCNLLKASAEEEGFEPQLALFENFASDASAILSMGNVSRAAALCVPTQNTHGFEIIHRRAVGAATRTLLNYVRRTCDP